MDTLSEVVRGELGRFGPEAVIGEIVERWPAAVGNAIARNAWPSRVARDGTVHVATADSIWAFELGHRAAEIAERLGVVAVRFAPGPLASAAETPAVAEAPAPSAELARAAAAIAAPIADEGLRGIVERTVGLGLARTAADRPV